MAHVNPIQVQKYLKGVDYPASKAALLEKARSMGADENICTSLEQLPDEEFEMVNAVASASSPHSSSTDERKRVFAASLEDFKESATAFSRKYDESSSHTTNKRTKI